MLRDNAKLNDFLSSLGSEMPRLGLDALGGENGKRMARVQFTNTRVQPKPGRW